MRAALIGLGLLMAALPCDGHAQSTPVMVELFTSQGCSSCPPADAVLARLAGRPDVVALSYHVDYWDDLGWKDPLASAAATARQKAYRDAFHALQIYTPQMVIGGKLDMPGQDMAPVARAIASVAAAGPSIQLTRAGDSVSVYVAEAPATAPLAVWLATYVPQVETAVARGENAGRKLLNVNVVREFHKLGRYDGAPLTLSASGISPTLGVAVWLQSDALGGVAAVSALPPG